MYKRTFYNSKILFHIRQIFSKNRNCPNVIAVYQDILWDKTDLTLGILIKVR